MSDLKKFIKIIKPYKKQAFVSVLLNAFSVIFALFTFTLVIPFLRILFNADKQVTEPVAFSFSAESLQHNLFYFLSNLIQTKGITHTLIIFSVIFILASLLKNLFVYLHKYFLAPIMNGIGQEYQKKLYEKFITLRLGFFTQERKGNLIARMTSDVNEIRQNSTNIIVLLFTGPITVLFYLFFLIFSSWQLTIFVFVALPIMGPIITRISRSLKKKAYLGQKIQGEILTNTEETISGLRIIKAFNAEKKAKQKFNKITDSFFKVMNKVQRRIWLASPMSEFMGTLIVMIIIFVGVSLVTKESSTLSSEAFIAYIVVFSQLISPAKKTINAYYSIQKGIASKKRIDEILNAEEKILNSKNAISKKSFTDKIEYSDVDFTYEDDEKTEVLHSINIEINKGETIAFVGESGSGKSTLVDLLPRFYDIKSGSIKIDNTDIRDIFIKDLRNLFGVVSQSSILFNDTIQNNIAFGVDEYSEEDLIEAAKIANAYDFIIEKPEKFQTNIGDEGSKLSGGQRQRISIARAVLKNPPILILDEATSALDTESEKLVQDALNKIMKNRTAIVIAHRLSTVKNADRIYVIHEGRIIEQGKHEELIKLEGTYKKLVDMQMV